MRTMRLLLIEMLILGSLLEACVVRNVAPQSSPNQTVAPTMQPSVAVTDLVVGQTPSYRGITPGISHKRDLLAQWGSPNVIRTYEEYESLHYFDIAEEYVLVKDGIVQAVTSNALQYQLTQDGRPATLDDLFQVLGTPEVITPTFGYPTLIFPRYGLAVSKHFACACPYQLFVPTSLQEYQKTLWSGLPLGYDPFPLISSVETVDIKPGQTTRDQVAQLLGNPDRIVYQDRNAPWSYDVEPDMLGRLHIFFDTEDTVKYIDVSPFYKVSQPLLLEDIVNQYGQPDMLQLMPGIEGQKYETLALLYLDRGLRVATKCITSTCEIVKRDARVIQKWYFQPITLAEYQAMFSSQDSAYESAYVEWPGFDE